MVPPWNVDNDFDIPAPAYRQWTGQSCWPPVHARLTSKQTCVCKEDKASCWLAFVLSMNVSSEGKQVLQTTHAQMDQKS